MKKMKLIGYFLAAVQLILSVLLIIFVTKTQMVPLTYRIIAGFFLILLFAAVVFLAKRKRKAPKILGIIISIFLIVVLALGIYYVRITDKTIDEVTGVKIEIDEINVYVSKDDSVSTINEAVENNYVFGTVATDDQKHIEETIDKINKDFDVEIQTKQYESIFQLVGDFDNGSVNAIIANSGTILVLDSTEEHADYSKSLKVIMETTYKEKIVEEEESKELDQDHFCIYFSGIDTFGPVTQKSRSDVNIIGVVNNETKTILLVSTPRDYYVTLATAGGVKDKLTHGGIYGIDCSMDTLEDLYDVDLDYYVRINFSGFQDIINQLGGIEVNSEYSFVSETEEGTYSFNKGINYLNGEQALGFARARHAFADGDRQRGRNQMQVIKATIEKLESSETLKNYSNIMAQMEGSFQTDMEKDQVGYLVQSTLDDGNWTVLTYSVSGSDAMQTCYSLGTGAYVMVPYENDVEYATELINKVLSGESLTQDEINVYIEKKDAEDVGSGTVENDDTSEAGE